MTEDDGLPLGEEELERPPWPRRWWVAGLVLLVGAAVVATFIPGLLPREGTASGSGFVIAEGGYVLTAAHVVEGATEVTVHGDGRSHRATPVAASAELDLALLRVDALLPAATLAGAPAEPGDEVTAVGHPAGAGRPVVLSTRVAGAGWLEAVGPGLRGVIVTLDPFRRGYSGAPLVNSGGEVVGMVTGNVGRRSEGELGLAVPLHRIADWLARLGIVLPVAADEAAPGLIESARAAAIRPSVVRVEARFPPGSR